MATELAYLLVGDHLGQVKKVLLPSGEISLLHNNASPSSSNPVVSIEPIPDKNKQLIATKLGELTVYDCIRDESKFLQKQLASEDQPLLKAIPISDKSQVLLYNNVVKYVDGKEFTRQKKGAIHTAKIGPKRLAYVGKDIPLKVFDLETKNKVYEADVPDKDWLGIRPEVFVSDLDYVSPNCIATSSKSDSVIRVYDTLSKPKPVISIDLDQTAFNEHAESARFVSVAAASGCPNTVVVGSNVGQIFAIDLRLKVKQVPKKKKQPRNYKILGGFKGARGASIKDVKLLGEHWRSEVDEEGDTHHHGGYKVISCCLDRYVRIHNFTQQSRHLDKQVYMTTKPYCCSPVLYTG